jgi:hypothetical protein
LSQGFDSGSFELWARHATTAPRRSVAIGSVHLVDLKGFTEVDASNGHRGQDVASRENGRDKNSSSPRTSSRPNAPRDPHISPIGHARDDSLKVWAQRASSTHAVCTLENQLEGVLLTAHTESAQTTALGEGPRPRLCRATHLLHPQSQLSQLSRDSSQHARTDLFGNLQPLDPPSETSDGLPQYEAQQYDHCGRAVALCSARATVGPVSSSVKTS